MVSSFLAFLKRLLSALPTVSWLSRLASSGARTERGDSALLAYRRLCQELPLIPIRTEYQLYEARKLGLRVRSCMIDEAIRDSEAARGIQAYLTRLSHLVADYELRRRIPDLKPIPASVACPTRALPGRPPLAATRSLNRSRAKRT